MTMNGGQIRILAVSMATAAILKKSNLNSTTSHGI
jgi:hypothetical protein